MKRPEVWELVEKFYLDGGHIPNDEDFRLDFFLLSLAREASRPSKMIEKIQKQMIQLAREGKEDSYGRCFSCGSYITDQSLIYAQCPFCKGSIDYTDENEDQKTSEAELSDPIEEKTPNEITEETHTEEPNFLDIPDEDLQGLDQDNDEEFDDDEKTHNDSDQEFENADYNNDAFDEDLPEKIVKEPKSKKKKPAEPKPIIEDFDTDEFELPIEVFQSSKDTTDQNSPEEKDDYESNLKILSSVKTQMQEEVGEYFAKVNMSESKKKKIEKEKRKKILRDMLPKIVKNKDLFDDLIYRDLMALGPYLGVARPMRVGNRDDLISLYKNIVSRPGFEIIDGKETASKKKEVKKEDGKTKLQNKKGSKKTSNNTD